MIKISQSIFALALFVTLLNGCEGQSAKDIRTCEQSVLAHLKSPASAKFSEQKLIDEKSSADYLQKRLDETKDARKKLAELPKLDSSTPGIDAALRYKINSANSERDALDKKLGDEWSRLYDVHQEAVSKPLRIVTLAVDSQNSMGAMMRSDASCTVRAGIARVDTLDQR